VLLRPLATRLDVTTGVVSGFGNGTAAVVASVLAIAAVVASSSTGRHRQLFGIGLATAALLAVVVAVLNAIAAANGVVGGPAVTSYTLASPAALVAGATLVAFTGARRERPTLAPRVLADALDR